MHGGVIIPLKTCSTPFSFRFCSEGGGRGTLGPTFEVARRTSVIIPCEGNLSQNFEKLSDGLGAGMCTVSGIIDKSGSWVRRIELSWIFTRDISAAVSQLILDLTPSPTKTGFERVSAHLTCFMNVLRSL